MLDLSAEEMQLLKEFASNLKIGFLDKNKQFNYSLRTYFIFRELSYKSSAELYVLALNTLCELIKIDRFEMRENDVSNINKMKIIETLVKRRTSKFVLVHGHSEGVSSSPTIEEIQFTKEIKRMSEFLGLKFEDHLVIGKDGYFSFRDEEVL